MKRRMELWFKSFLLILLMAGLAALTGCSGDDGAQGPAGQPGAKGDTGPVGTTVETCDLCHPAGRIADIGVAHPAPLDKPIVSNIIVARSDTGDPLTDLLTVTFQVTESDGITALPGIMAAPGDADNLRVYMADIVPAGTVTANAPQTTWDTDFLEIWAEERGGDAGVVATDLGGGNYSFVMVTNPGDITAEAPEGDLAHTQRIYVRADARDIVGFNRTIGVADFTMPAAGADTGVIDTTGRTIVDASACTACHNDPLQRAAHGGGYQSPQVCNMCHSPIGVEGDNMQASGWWLASLIHRIHDAQLLPGIWPGRAQLDASEVTYPKDIIDCEACHFNAGQDMATAWKDNPTMEVCTTCHTTIVFDGVTQFVGLDGVTKTHFLQTDNTGCSSVACHPASGNPTTGVTEAHVPDRLKGDHSVSITPNYTASISLSPDPGVDGYYNTGDVITVTVTVAGTSSGNYDDPEATSAFTGANLYVYGPRAEALPVLTTGSTTDPAFDPAAGEPTQSHSMFIDSTDPQVKTDATGFKYELLPIPADLADGTYMVQTAISHPDSRITGSRNYNIDGWALTTFQVGTATEELKVAGDGCDSCHVLADWTSTAHRAYFGTDGCLACHDQSGGHADPIANRVHAVHAATVNGDFNNRDWSEITFPQNISSCDACHTSGNDSFVTQPATDWSHPCVGCHGDDGALTTDHISQFGGQLP